LRGNLTAACQEEQLSILQRLGGVSNGRVDMEIVGRP